MQTARSAPSTGISFAPKQITSPHLFSGGVAWLKRRGDVMSLLFANAHSEQNTTHLIAQAPSGYAMGAGMPFPDAEFETRSTSGLCWGYGKKADTFYFAEANQNGEANRVFFITNGEVSELKHEALVGGDNYHCSFENLTEKDRIHLLFTDTQGHASVFEVDGTELISNSTSISFPWTSNQFGSSATAAADFNLDGWHDLFVASPTGRDILYRNAGDGNFHEYTSNHCPLETGKGLTSGASWVDFDNDGDPDLVISKLGSPNIMLRNDNGCFRVSQQPNLATYSYQTWSSAAGDFDLDGDLDIAFGNYDGPIQVFENIEGVFELALEASHPDGKHGGSSGIAAADADTDGDLDLAVAFWDQRANLILQNTFDGPTNTKAVNIEVVDANLRPLFNASAVVKFSDGRALYLHTSGSAGLRSQTVPAMNFGAGDLSSVKTVDIWHAGKLVTTCKQLKETLSINIEAQNPC